MDLIDQCLVKLRSLHEAFADAAHFLIELQLDVADLQTIYTQQLVLWEMRDILNSLQSGPMPATQPGGKFARLVAPELSDEVLCALRISREQFPLLCARMDELEVERFTGGPQILPVRISSILVAPANIWVEFATRSWRVRH